jgi:Putative transmembrane protein (PGPGW)
MPLAPVIPSEANAKWKNPVASPQHNAAGSLDFGRDDSHTLPMNRWLQKWITRLGLETRPRLRKFLVGIIGGTIILIGLAMTVLPGPAIVVIPVGFAILATEFAWARRVWRRGKILVARVRSGGRAKVATREPEHTR